MYNLIIKDILVQKKTMLFAVLYSLFILIALGNPVFDGLIYMMGSMALACVYMMTAPVTEDKNKVDLVINSLPVKRSQVVAARYVSVLVFVALSLLIMQAAGLLLHLVPVEYFQKRFLNGWDIVVTYSGVILLASIYYPILYWLGSSFTRVFFMILFLLLFFAPANIAEYVRDNPSAALVQSLTNWAAVDSLGLIVAVFAVLLGIHAVSGYIATCIYQTKDL